ncbi:MAG: sucrase ferredoxin [Actinomycetes bacterium]
MTSGGGAEFRCSSASESLEEPIAGTASTVRGLLLVECPGGWGIDALVGSRLPDAVKRWLRDVQRLHKVRPLLIRRHGGHRTADGARVFAGHVGRSGPFLETTVLDDVRQVVDLPVPGLASGERPGLTPYDDPLFLVCTHGKHDVCCAERGRPLCKALHDVAPDHTWEVSHIGGDRFAPNVLVLPEGLYYGRLTPEEAPAFVETVRAGRLDVEHLRGRCAFPFALQAAEVFLRQKTGHSAGGRPQVVEQVHDDRGMRIRFRLGLGEWDVRLVTEPAEARRLTCRASALGTALRHTLLGVTRVG